MSELREVIGALQSEVEIETAVSELGAAGIEPRSRPLSRRSPAPVPSWHRLAERPRRRRWRRWLPEVVWAGWQPCSGITTKRTFECNQILNGGIVLIVHPATAEQFEAATAIMRRYCGTSPSAWQRASPLTHHRQ